MMYVVLWLMFAVAASSIATAKGYSGVTWFFGGLFFGPFGLIIGFYPSKKQADANARTSAQSRKCPLCAEEILVAAIKCKHCGADVPALPPPPPPTSAQQESARLDERNKTLFWMGSIVFFCLVVSYGCSGR